MRLYLIIRNLVDLKVAVLCLKRLSGGGGFFSSKSAFLIAEAVSSPVILIPVL